MAFGEMRISGTYTDVMGETYFLDQIIDVGSMWNQTTHAVKLRAYRGPLLPFYQEVTDIKRALRKIAKR